MAALSMGKGYHVSVLGDGRIGQAVRYYFERTPGIGRVDFLADERSLQGSHLLVGALPGELGEKGLRLALKYRVPFLDISDIDPPFYFRHRKAISEKGILVMPGCGLCPGIVNFLLAREIKTLSGQVEDVEILAGSLSDRDHYFPFLWCFEDLINEHRIPSFQMISGRKKKFPPFAGYREENYGRIQAESYYCASGFENVLDQVKVKTLVCRVVRPRGFRDFFLFLEGMGALEGENLLLSKKILEARKKSNYTLAEVRVRTRKAEISWVLKSYSRPSGPLNSMQMMTASVAVVMGQLFLEKKIPQAGLVFLGDLCADPAVLAALVKGLKARGVKITRIEKGL
ncbi:MAG TPA: hypothetical protein PLT76_08380 [Candidatus Omnitrophota bacterium]|nr:hypothetical protein [Candidatus Omnitrophota bacterium]HQO58717.1 hypothetical protein [Candidatus Omnitrophota bacterium]